MNKRQKNKIKKKLDKIRDKYFKPWYIPMSKKDRIRESRLFKILGRNQIKR
jgi:hypothetical protein